MANHQEQKQHWVEEVFPPTFSSTSNKTDLGDGVDNATSEENMKQIPSVYDMVARRYVVVLTLQCRQSH